MCLASIRHTHTVENASYLVSQCDRAERSLKMNEQVNLNRYEAVSNEIHRTICSNYDGGRRTADTRPHIFDCIVIMEI